MTGEIDPRLVADIEAVYTGSFPDEIFEKMRSWCWDEIHYKLTLLANMGDVDLKPYAITEIDLNEERATAENFGWMPEISIIEKIRDARTILALELSEGRISYEDFEQRFASSQRAEAKVALLGELVSAMLNLNPDFTEQRPPVPEVVASFKSELWSRIQEDQGVGFLTEEEAQNFLYFMDVFLSYPNEEESSPKASDTKSQQRVSWRLELDSQIDEIVRGLHDLNPENHPDKQPFIHNFKMAIILYKASLGFERRESGQKDDTQPEVLDFVEKFAENWTMKLPIPLNRLMNITEQIFTELGWLPERRV